MKFNPKVSEFLAEKPNVTVIGLYWAGYWRLAVCIFAVYMAFVVLAAMVAAIIS